MSAAALYRIDVEDSTGKQADSITLSATSEDEARRNAEDLIRQRNLRIKRIHHASATMAGTGALTVNAVIQRGADRSLYETDTAAWAQQQSDALHRRATNEIDWDNIAEEIEDLAASERREIRNRLAVICEHLLKWAYQSEHRSGSWRGSVVEARDRIADVLEASPSLEPYPATRLAKSYAAGRRKAEAETGFTGLPETCPWTIEQVLDHVFWPATAKTA